MVIVASCITGKCQYYATNIVNYPTIGYSLATNIARYRKQFVGQGDYYYPKKLVTAEGIGTDPASSAQSAYDLYAIHLKNNPNRGRLLRITMGGTSLWGLASLPTIKDVATGEQFVMTLARFDTRTSEYDYTHDTEGMLSRLYHTGHFIVDGSVIHVKIQYHSTPRYPTMKLTWGYESGPGIPGFFVDKLEDGPEPSLNGVYPSARISWSTMAYVAEEEDGTGLLFPVTFLEATSQFEYVFETSDDLVNWNETTSVYIENSDSNTQFWGIIHQPGSEKQFTRFRIVE